MADFLVSLPPDTSGFVGLCAALLGLHCERENEKPEMATASARGHCAVKWLRHYGETKRRDLKAFKEACEAGDLKGMAKGVTGSLGLKRMNPRSKTLEEDCTFALQCLIAYMGYETVAKSSVIEAVDQLLVTSHDHSMKMRPTELVTDYEARCEAARIRVDLAIQASPKDSWSRPRPE